MVLNTAERVWNSKRKFGILSLSVVIMLSILSSPVFAADIEISVPDSGIEIGKTVTLPVIMHDAVDISTFTFEVGNTTPHVTVTINPARPIAEGSYEVANNPEKSSQKILWYGTTDISGDQIELFSIDVTADRDAITEIPVTLNTIEVARITKTGVEDLTTSYATTTVKLNLTDGETNQSVLETPVNTPKPADSGVTSTTQSVSETPVCTPKATDISVPQKTPAAKTPLPLLSMVFGIIAASGCIIVRNKGRIL